MNLLLTAATIRRRRRHGELASVLAAEYAVSEQVIQAICATRTVNGATAVLAPFVPRPVPWDGESEASKEKRRVYNREYMRRRRKG